MELDVKAEVGRFDGKIYEVTIKGTALLDFRVRGWSRTKSIWWGSRPDPGADLTFDIPKALYETGRGTFLEVAIYRVDSAPGKGPSLWSGRYWVRNTAEGPVLEEA